MSEGSTEQSEQSDASKDYSHYVYKKATGDMEITAKLEKLDLLTTMHHRPDGSR